MRCLPGKMSFGGNRIGCLLTSCDSTLIEQNIFEKLALSFVLDRILCHFLIIFVMLKSWGIKSDTVLRNPAADWTAVCFVV